MSRAKGIPVGARVKRYWRALPIALPLFISGCADEAGGADVRDQIRIVGSSTVYPFAQVVAEHFVRDNEGFKSPIIEATGTGAGIKLFCGGVGARFPDVVNASRRLKASEYGACAKNGVTDIVEVQVGIDGISLGESVRGPKLSLTTAEIYRALALTPYGRPQTARTWADVNPTLPAIPIVVYGPPSTSGTRDALAELIMTKGCDSDPAMKALKAADEDKHKKVCTTVREDGAFVDAGENDNLIVQKVNANPNALGVFGYSFLEENRDKLIDVPINGVGATYATISDFSYPGARPLYIYVKAAHARAIPGLRQFVAEWVNGWSAGGYLKARGMIVAPPAAQAKAQADAREMRSLDPESLK